MASRLVFVGFMKADGEIRPLSSCAIGWRPHTLLSSSVRWLFLVENWSWSKKRSEKRYIEQNWVLFSLKSTLLIQSVPRTNLAATP